MLGYEFKLDPFALPHRWTERQYQVALEWLDQQRQHVEQHSGGKGQKAKPRDAKEATQWAKARWFAATGYRGEAGQ